MCGRRWPELEQQAVRTSLYCNAAILGLVDLVLAPPQQPEPDYDYM